jgi:hypothetical protein
MPRSAARPGGERPKHGRRGAPKSACDKDQLQFALAHPAFNPAVRRFLAGSVRFRTGGPEGRKSCGKRSDRKGLAMSPERRLKGVAGETNDALSTQPLPPDWLRFMRN